MTRQTFINQLGLGTSALMALYCLGGLTACSSSDDPVPAAGPVDFTLDLSAATNAPLLRNGGFVVQNSVIVARTVGGDLVALSRICTHQGGEVAYEPNNDAFICPNHYSVFRNDGTVREGPATRALRRYNVQLDAATNRLRVFS